MLSPVVTQVVDGITVNESKAEQYCEGGFVNFFPSKLDGTSATPFVMTVGRSADWTAANADAQIEVVIAVPNTIDTPAALINLLRTKTVADLTSGQRSQMQAIFDNHSIPRSDFTLSTPLSRIFRRLVSFLFENDENFGLGFNF